MKIKELIKNLKTYDPETIVSLTVETSGGFTDKFTTLLLNCRVDVYTNCAAYVLGEHVEALHGLTSKQKIEKRLVFCRLDSEPEPEPE